MPLTLPDILFAISAVLAVSLSLSVVLARNPVRSTLLLILSFLPVSLAYVLMRAPFAAILQILVYAGAIMMLFTFVIMMINPAPQGGEVPGEEEGEGVSSATKPSRGGSALWAFLLAGAGLVLIPPVRWAANALMPVGAAPAHEGFGGVHSIAQLLFADPANNPLTVSFELISALILVGVIAAVNYGRRHSPRADLKSAPTVTPAEPPVAGDDT